MTLFMWTLFILGLSVGILLSFVWFYFRIKRWQESEEYKAKTAMVTYRADVALATHEDRMKSDTVIRQQQKRIDNLIEFNRRLATAIDNGGKNNG